VRETFADLTEILPRYRDLSIPDLITSTVKKPPAALDRAIRAKDGNQFAVSLRTTDSIVQQLPPELRSRGNRNPAPDGIHIS
jgi:hypothetical protein